MPIDEEGNWREATDEKSVARIENKIYIRSTTGERHTCSICKKKKKREYMHPTERVTRWAQREWECDDCSMDGRTRIFLERLEEDPKADKKWAEENTTYGPGHEKTTPKDKEIID